MSVTSQANPKPRSRRRWFQYRLRTLFVLPVLFAAGWWWLTWPQHTAHRFVFAMTAQRYDDARALWRASADDFDTAVALSPTFSPFDVPDFTAMPRTWSDLLLSRQHFITGQAEFTAERGRVVGWTAGIPEGPPGWKEFFVAVEYLCTTGDRAKAAQLFHKVATEYPTSDYAVNAERLRSISTPEHRVGSFPNLPAYRLQMGTPIDSEEIAELLEQMVKEDAGWVEPSNVNQLGMEERIHYDIYHLRNVAVLQTAQPSSCSVLSRFEQLDPFAYNAAVDLRNIGKQAIPALMAILDDRRPTRSVGYHRLSHPSRTLLRYQDAAWQILDALVPNTFFGGYLSTAPPDQREKLIAQCRQWYKQAKDLPKEEQEWLAIGYLETWPALQTIKSLATDEKRKERALAELRRLYEGRHWSYVPRIAEVMAELGDTSVLPQVFENLRQGKYDGLWNQPPFYPTADPYAKEVAEKLLRQYGSQVELNPVPDSQ